MWWGAGRKSLRWERLSWYQRERTENADQLGSQVEAGEDWLKSPR